MGLLLGFTKLRDLRHRCNRQNGGGDEHERDVVAVARRFHADLHAAAPLRDDGSFDGKG